MDPKTVYEAFRRDPNNDMQEYGPWLIEHAKGIIFEIGVRNGCSTSAFLLGLQQNGGHLYSVDINPDCAGLFAGHPQWTFILGDSKDPLVGMHPIMGPYMMQGFDILMIDGDHSYEAVKRDLENYSPFVRPGGMILMHDVAPTVDITPELISKGWFDLSGVRPAFEEFVQETGFKSEILPGIFGLGVIYVK